MQLRTAILILGFALVGLVGFIIVNICGSKPQPPPGKKAPEKKDLLTLAEEAYNRGDHDTAVKLFSRVRASGGADEKTLLHMGVSLCVIKRFDNAIEILDRYALLHPDDAEGLAAAGRACYGKACTSRPPAAEPMNKAAGYFQSALKADASNADALLGMGRIHVKRTEYAKAEKFFLRAAESAPRSIPVRRALYMLYGLTKDEEKARTQYRVLMSLGPGEKK